MLDDEDLTVTPGRTLLQVDPPVSKELALNVMENYISALKDVGKGNLDPYQNQFCESFVVKDPVGTKKRHDKQQLQLALEDRQDLLMPEGFMLEVHAKTIAQDYKYTAVFATMVVPDAYGLYEKVNRTDLLTISQSGCVQNVTTYWSAAGSLLSSPASDRHKLTEKAIRDYLTALHKLGTGTDQESYFSKFAKKNLKVHDPYGGKDQPMESVEVLKKRIPELAASLAPKGFTVTVKGVLAAHNPRYGSAHLVLNIVGGPSVDIIDIFKITGNGKVKDLKAVWHIY
eukprot:CAMPEP_0172683724 /NCGR_PEP_ID=MMETSP1074-20121228/19055_1 /TAXON_ID=2916 /ORGANISM="Ceratium fusus, Strain PA161109" /LENGTH=284 /DNA_ID=CAMNT_0013502615 /DNA_START=144 /DNA_END=998 /DNA_ORIENTATION=-